MSFFDDLSSNLKQIPFGMNAMADSAKLQSSLASKWTGGSQQQPGLPTNDEARRMASIQQGANFGQQEFYNDPDMQRLRALREQYAKGYSGQELGGMREQARGEIAGQQQAAQRQLASNLGRGGVGGARAAAIQNTAAQQGVKTTAEAERKMALDSANMQRQGASDLQDFLFRQKMGKMGTAFGMAGLASQDYATQQAAAQANKPRSATFWDPMTWGNG